MADPSPMIPKEALDYIKRKSLKPAFSYRDVWNEEHATGFTVAKAMQTDLLQDIKGAVEAAIENGQTFDAFRKDLRPTLEGKGWWGRKTMVDPVTGKTVDAQLGSNRRLKTIYQTNIRSAYNQGVWERGQASPAHPYIMYRIGPSQNHREEHRAWDGLVLPKDDPFWNAHYPPNDWGCKCYPRFISQATYERFKASGVPSPKAVDGSGGGSIPIKTDRPPEQYKTWVDARTGRVERLPVGIGPGFGWNPGLAGRPVPVLDTALTKARANYPTQYEELARTLMTNTIMAERHRSFVDRAAAKAIDKRYLDPVGFLDRRTLAALARRGTVPTSNAISLEAGLVQSAKLDRHALKGERPAIEDWYLIVDYLLDASIYEDGADLVYLSETPSGIMKVVVTPAPKKGGSLHGSTFRGPTVVTMYKPQADEVARIRALKKVR
jgi:hypothetical protein